MVGRNWETDYSHHEGKGFSRGREPWWRPIFLSTEEIKASETNFFESLCVVFHHHLCFSCCHFISGTDSAQEHFPSTQLLNSSAPSSSRSDWGSHSKSRGVRGVARYTELQNNKNSLRKKNDRASLSLMKCFHTFSSKSCHGMRVLPLKTFNKKPRFLNNLISVTERLPQKMKPNETGTWKSTIVVLASKKNKKNLSSLIHN